MSHDHLKDSVLIVDDEEGIRRTFHEWLRTIPDIQIYVASDAESALQLANTHPIDLAILDWNLGSGSHGLQLLEDLVDFQPEIVAILVSGFANIATPLDALRMGVRDYLDKSHQLSREVLVNSVRKQLDRIRPAKRQRLLNQRLAEFRETVRHAMALIHDANRLNDPVPLPNAVHSLFRFLLRLTGANDGVLIIRREPDETVVYGKTGERTPCDPIPFPRTLAASVVSQQQACILRNFQPEVIGPVTLQPFERERSAILAVAFPVGSGVQVILELFDKPEFTNDDRANVAAAAEIGGELIRQAISEHHSQGLLLDALDTAVRMSENLTNENGQVLPNAVMQQLKQDLAEDQNSVADAETSVRLLDAVRKLAQKHGPDAVDHCVRMIESLLNLLDNR